MLEECPPWSGVKNKKRIAAGNWIDVISQRKVNLGLERGGKFVCIQKVKSLILLRELLQLEFV